jgi:hypothetical protein
MVLCWLYFVGTSPFAASNKLDLFIAVSVELTDVSPQVFELRLVLNAGDPAAVSGAIKNETRLRRPPEFWFRSVSSV